MVDPDDRTRITARERLFDGQYDRLRDVQQRPDGQLYVLTSNRDARQPRYGRRPRAVHLVEVIDPPPAPARGSNPC